MSQEKAKGSGLDRVLVGEVARVTEAAAIAAARFRGMGNAKGADKAAVDAMRKELGKIHIRGTVVIGEGEMDEAPMLYIGEEVGIGDGPAVDIAVDPLEGTTICAKDMPNALAVIAVSERGGLLHAPDMYMDKIAIGPGYPEGIIDLDTPIAEQMEKLAKAKGVPVDQLTACLLDRPRHSEIIEAVRKVGAGIRLIPDGDIAGVIWATDPQQTGIDVYLGSGGAPEGVLAAAALRCIGGQMQGRLKPSNREEDRARREDGHSGHQSQILDAGDGLGRCDFFRDRRHQRIDPRRRALPRRLRRDRVARHALRHRHRPPHQDHLPQREDEDGWDLAFRRPNPLSPRAGRGLPAQGRRRSPASRSCCRPSSRPSPRKYGWSNGEQSDAREGREWI